MTYILSKEQIIEDGISYSGDIYLDAKKQWLSGEISYTDFLKLLQVSMDVFNHNYEQLAEQYLVE
jgi:hypothetical protein